MSQEKQLGWGGTGLRKPRLVLLLFVVSVVVVQQSAACLPNQWCVQSAPHCCPGIDPPGSQGCVMTAPGICSFTKQEAPGNPVTGCVVQTGFTCKPMTLTCCWLQTCTYKIQYGNWRLTTIPMLGSECIHW